MADARVVDGTLLEAAKENIRPLATPHAQRGAEHARFRSAIAAALESPDADALGAYAAYVDWTVETYPAGHASLVPLLEEATRALRGRYAQDARYVRLWAAYAALVARPALRSRTSSGRAGRRCTRRLRAYSSARAGERPP
jgi:hypothetical protein